jgi:hypothetical protein
MTCHAFTIANARNRTLDLPAGFPGVKVPGSLFRQRLIWNSGGSPHDVFPTSQRDNWAMVPQMLNEANKC